MIPDNIMREIQQLMDKAAAMGTEDAIELLEEIISDATSLLEDIRLDSID